MVTGEFDEEILTDLVSQGFQGSELIEKFKNVREQVPTALNKMLENIIAESGGESYSMDEVFNE